MKRVDELLAEVQSGLARLTPAEALAAAGGGALLVDVRSADEQRSDAGLVPGATHYPLSVLPWRVDPLPRETRVVLLCRHGYCSSLAARQLRELGFAHATDVVGGFEAWRSAGLPVDPI